MPNELRQKLEAILASIGFNDGANKGFWRIQPRDDEGQWIEMGADVLFRFRTGDGNLVVGTARGIYVGPGGRPGRARVMIEEGNDLGLEPGVYEVESRNLQQFKAILPEGADSGAGAGARKDKFGRPVQTLADGQLPALNDLLQNRQPITDEDRRLGRGELTPEEREAEADGREKSPIADLPAGFESENPEEVKKLLRESGIEPDDFDPEVKTKKAPKAPAATSDQKQKSKKRVSSGIVMPGAEKTSTGYDENGDRVDTWTNPDGTTAEVVMSWFQPFRGEYAGSIDKDRYISDTISLLPEVNSADSAGDKGLAAKNKVGSDIKNLKKLSDEELSAYIDRYAIFETTAISRDGRLLSPMLDAGIAEAERRGFNLPAYLNPPTPEENEKAIQDAFLATFDGTASAPELNDVISKAKLKPTRPMNLNVGDVVVDKDGKRPGTILEIRDLDASLGSRPRMKLQLEDGRIVEVPLDLKKPVNVVTGAKAKPVKPTKPAPAPTPTKPTPTKPTPEKPVKPTPEKPAPEKPAPKPKPEKVNLPNRKDDGKDIAPTTLSTEELRNKKIDNVIDPVTGKLLKVETNTGKGQKTIEDPNAIVDALLEVNPNAKIKEDGTIVMERGTFTDADGKSYKYEVGVQRTVGNQFMERYTITNPETGEVIHDFYNHDYKDSFYGLYGVANGLEKTRDLLLGRTVPGKKGVDSEGNPVDKELRNYFGPDKNIAQRLKYLRKTKDMGNWRLITPEENRDKFLSGRDRELNRSDTDFNKQYRNQFGNVLRSFIPDIYKAIKDGDEASVKEILVQTLGRMPDNQDAKDDLIRTLAKGIKDRFSGTPEYDRVKQLPRSLNRWLLQENLDLRDKDKVPFVSEDGVAKVEIGSVVRFVNNEGDFAIGTVVQLVPASGKNGNYKDTARVKFENQTVDNLQTRNMQILDPEDPDSKATDYAPWVRLDEKIRRRADELGIDFETWRRRKEDNPDYDPDGEESAIENAAARRGIDDVVAGGNAFVERAKKAFGKVADNPDNTTLNPRGSRSLGNKSTIEMYGTTSDEIKEFTDSDEMESEKYVKLADGNGVVVKPTENARQKKNEILAAGAAFYEKISSKLDGLAGRYKSDLDQAVAAQEAEVRAAGTNYDEKDMAVRTAGQAKLAYAGEERLKDPSLGGNAESALLSLLDREDPRMMELQLNYKNVFEEANAAKLAYWEASDRRSNAAKAYVKENGTLQQARRRFIRDELAKEGVQLDTVKVADFGSKFTFRSSTSDIKVSALKAELDEVFEYIPRPLLEALLQNESKIEFVGRTSRGSKESLGINADGTQSYKINTNSRDNSTFEVTLHELWHVFQAENPDLVPMEHALLFDRIAKEDGTLPGLRTIFDYSDSSEKMLDSGGTDPFASYYAQKIYPSFMDMGARLSPGTRATEVSTILMQGLFADQNLLRGGSRGRTEGRLLMKHGKGSRALKVGSDVYYNPADGKYYKDSAFSIPVNPDDIAGYAGKPDGQLDTTSINFALGLLIGYGKSNG